MALQGTYAPKWLEINAFSLRQFVLFACAYVRV